VGESNREPCRHGVDRSCKTAMQVARGGRVDGNKGGPLGDLTRGDQREGEQRPQPKHLLKGIGRIAGGQRGEHEANLDLV
jgi:hypothetical protein